MVFSRSKKIFLLIATVIIILYGFFSATQYIGIPEGGGAKIITLEAISGDFAPGEKVTVSIEYYTKPPPADFSEKFLSKIKLGIIIETHDSIPIEDQKIIWNGTKRNVTGKIVDIPFLIVMPKNGISVFIGNDPGWERNIKIIG